MPGAHLEAVLLDVGGTLVRLDYAAIARHARELDLEVTEDALARGEAAARLAIDRRAWRHGAVPGTDAGRLPSYFDDLLEAAGVPEPARSALGRRLEAEHRRHNLWRVPLDGALDTLAALRRRGLRLAVVSNADGRAERLLEQVGLARHLDVVVDSHCEGVEKPHPEIFARALARLGARAEHAAHVGDIVSIDVAGAWRAGLRAVLLDPTGSYADVGCERIAALPELLDLVEREG